MEGLRISMAKKYCISDCMKSKVIFGPPEMSVKMAAGLMAENNVGTLPNLVIIKNQKKRNLFVNNKSAQQFSSICPDAPVRNCVEHPWLENKSHQY